MIKADNLMTGDFVTFKDDTTARIEIVGIISYDTVHGFINGDDVSDEISIEDLAGISLTPEILEKNFESKDNPFGFQDYELGDGFILENRGYRFCLVKRILNSRSTFYVCDIHHIHQLQNILRAVGIETQNERFLHC